MNEKTYTFTVTAAERDALLQLADYVRAHRGRFEWSLDAVLRFCLEETNKRFGLGAWPVAPGADVLAGQSTPEAPAADRPVDQSAPEEQASDTDQPVPAPKRGRKS